MEKLKGKVKQLNKDSITVVASSDAVDRDGDILDPKGWDLKNFQTNPVLLWSHNASELPIGKVLDVHTEGNELVAEVKFADHEFASTVETLVRDGFINTTSVGFMPQEVSEKDGLSSKQELLELSFVNVPSNPTATVRRGLKWKGFQAKVKEFEAKVGDKKDVNETVALSRVVDELNFLISAFGNNEVSKEVLTKMNEALVILMETLRMEAVIGVKEFKKEEKAGRIISEKNRNILKVGREALQSTIEVINELLEVSEIQPKEITVPDKKGVIDIKVKGNKVNKTLRLAKMIDKIAEAMIVDEKDKGVKKK